MPGDNIPESMGEDFSESVGEDISERAGAIISESMGGFPRNQQHFDPKVTQAIRILAAEKDITVQVLLAQALNDYLEKNGRERLADERALPRGAAARAK